MNDIVEKLRSSASGLGSEDPHKYIARGITAGDCLDAANLIEHGATLEVGIIAMHSVSGCWLQPDSSWALECACGAWFREETKGEARFAWAGHVRDKARAALPSHQGAN